MESTKYTLTTKAGEFIAEIKITATDERSIPDIINTIILGFDTQETIAPHGVKIYDKLGNWCNPPKEA